MPKDRKEINELLDLAKSTEDESIFKELTRYKNFKEKRATKLKQNDLKKLYLNLFTFNCNEECIFWSTKYFEKLESDKRVLTKVDRHDFLNALIQSHFRLRNWKNVVDYGHQILQGGFLQADDYSMFGSIYHYLYISFKHLQRSNESCGFS